MSSRIASAAIAARNLRLLVVIAAAAFEHPARADNGIIVVGGSADEHVRATAGAAIDAAAREIGWTVETKPLPKKDSDALLACKDPKLFACLPASLNAAGVHLVLVVKVDNTVVDGEPQFAIEGKLVTTSPQGYFWDRRYCQRCADDRLQQESTEFARELLRKNATTSGRTVVEIKSQPAGAQVTLDGTLVGVTDFATNSFPGKHVVLVEKPGFQSETQTFTVEEGKTAEVSITLHRSDVRTPGSPQHASRVVPGIAIGAGAALVAFGGYGLYLGTRGGRDDKFEYTRGTSIGIGAGIIGLGAIVYGAYALVHDKGDSGPTASAVSGGAVVGWTGRF